MAKLKKRSETIKEKAKKPDAAEPTPKIIGRMPKDFREDAQPLVNDPFGRVSDAEAEAMRRRMIQREDGFMGRFPSYRGRGFG